MIYKTNIYPELCCDYCNEIIHNHFDCPICREEWASTDAYFDLEDIDKDEPNTFMCDNCGTEFRYIDKETIELLDPKEE